MKRTDLKKLQLKTTTIRVLDNRTLEHVAGGQVRTIYVDCSGSCTNPTLGLCGCYPTFYCP
jgi:hypothetical protein